VRYEPACRLVGARSGSNSAQKVRKAAHELRLAGSARPHRCCRSADELGNVRLSNAV